jgi:hypothetical protein
VPTDRVPTGVCQPPIVWGLARRHAQAVARGWHAVGTPVGTFSWCRNGGGRLPWRRPTTFSYAGAGAWSMLHPNTTSRPATDLLSVVARRHALDMPGHIGLPCRPCPHDVHAKGLETTLEATLRRARE